MGSVTRIASSPLLPGGVQSEPDVVLLELPVDVIEAVPVVELSVALVVVLDWSTAYTPMLPVTRTRMAAAVRIWSFEMSSFI